MHEFDVIRKYFAPLSRGSKWLHAGIGEDCALLDGALFSDAHLVTSTDTLVEGKHFPVNLPATMGESLASRVLGATFSDLAACGAQPLGFSLALCMPDINQTWLKSFSKGLADFMQEWSVELLGGDLSEGALSMTVHVVGSVPKTQALRRNGAQHGDDVYLSGCTGEAAAALMLLDGDIDVATDVRKQLMRRYWSPKPRFELAINLRDLASAVIDISDGLLADAGHIAQMSACGVRINHKQIPLSHALQEVAEEHAIDLALSGGDDYELLFTAPQQARHKLSVVAQSCSLACTRIGSVVAGEEAICTYQPAHSGWQHFA